MNRLTMLSLCVLCVLCGSVSAKEPVKSGTPIGERPGPYSFNVATGPQRGEQFCYICETGEKPGLIVFARQKNEALAKLLVSLDAIVSPKPEDSGVRGWVTMLGEDHDLNELAAWGKKSALRQIVLGQIDDPLGPPTYELNEQADVTVLFFVKEKVVANFAFREGELNEKAIKDVMKATDSLKD